jgi:hypothetical protein
MQLYNKNLPINQIFKIFRPIKIFFWIGTGIENVVGLVFFYWDLLLDMMKAQYSSTNSVNLKKSNDTTCDFYYKKEKLQKYCLFFF